MKTSINIAQVAERFSASFPPAEGYAELFRALLGELAKGRPVSREALAAALGWPPRRVGAVLKRLPDTEYEDGNIVGSGLTLRETPHVFNINGQRLYTWCALDSLIFPALIGKTARVLSTCAATGAPIRLTVTPDGVRDVEPAGAVMSLVVPEASANVRSSFCCHVNFLASATVAEKWVSRHGSAAIVSIEDAFLLGQELIRRLFGAGQERKPLRRKRRQSAAPAKFRT